MPRHKKPTSVPSAPSSVVIYHKDLSIPLIEQEQNQWCWAACMEMVAAYRKVVGVTQCGLAEMLHDELFSDVRDCCCSAAASAGCDRAGPVTEFRRLYRRWNIAPSCRAKYEHVTEWLLQDRLKKDDAVQVYRQYPHRANQGHVVLVAGFRVSRQASRSATDETRRFKVFYRVRDPQRDSLLPPMMSYARLRDGWPGGARGAWTWCATWFLPL